MDIKKEQAQKLNDKLKYYKNTLINKIAEFRKVYKTTSELDIECYKKNNHECMTQFENFERTVLDFDRRMDKERDELHQVCWYTTPRSLRPENEFEWNYTSEETIQALFNFEKCASPYYEKCVKLVEEKIKVAHEAAKRLKKFNE